MRKGQGRDKKKWNKNWNLLAIENQPKDIDFSIALANFIVITITTGRVGISAAL